VRELQVDIALLADYAAVTVDKKLVAGGIFGAIVGLQLPVVHSRMYLALQLRVLGGEEDEHKVAVRLVDPDGKTLLELGGPLRVQRRDVSADTTVPFIIDLAAVKFEKWGPHSFDIFINDRFIERVELSVSQIPTSSATRDEA
jgi:hypothetical protein